MVNSGFTSEARILGLALRITNAKPEPIENGGEAAGTWDVTCATDADGFEGNHEARPPGQHVGGHMVGVIRP